MRRVVVWTLIIGLLWGTAYAQEAVAVDITLFRDEDSLTIYAPVGASLNGLALQVTLLNNQVVTHALQSYPGFRGVPVSAIEEATCFRLVRVESAIPVPLECQSAALHTQELSDADLFWYDNEINQGTLVTVLGGEAMVGLCAAGASRCVVTFVPSEDAGDVPLCDGAADIENREVLVVIAQFDKISDSPLNPHREWEAVLEDAIAQLEGEVNARVLTVSQVITSQQEALALSDCYLGTLVIWGKLTAARVESNYTAVTRWSLMSEQPGQTRFNADRWQPQSVIDQLTLFVSLDGTDAEYVSSFVLGQLLYFGGDRAAALPFLETAIKEISVGHEQAMGASALYAYTGYILEVVKSDLNAAEIAYNQAIALDPDFVPAYNGRGNVHWQQGELEAALAEYNQAIALDPDFVPAYNGRGNVYMQQGESEAALGEYNQAIALDPNFAAAYVYRGYIYAGRGESEAALGEYNQAIALDPNFAVAYLNRGNIYVGRGELETALADYNQAITLDPNFAVAYVRRGDVYIGRGELETALADYNQAITLDPNYAFAYTGRGNVYIQQGELETALADYNQAITLDPNYAFAYANRGYIYRQQGEMEAALGEYNQAIALNSNFAVAYTGRGNVYRQQGELEAALADYNHALVLDPDDGSPYLDRGILYALQDDMRRAGADYWLWIQFIQADISEIIAFENQVTEFNTMVAMTKGWVYFIRFQASAGQILNASAAAVGEDRIDPLMVILDDGDIPLYGDDDSGGSFDAQISGFIVPEDGLYTLVVSHAGGGSEGRVKVQIELTESPAGGG